jgi:N-acetylneuraminic acid mutarotase
MIRRPILFSLCPLVAAIAIGCAAKSVGSIHAESIEGPRIPVRTAGHAGGIVQGLPVIAGGSSWALDKSSKSWLRDCFVFKAGAWAPGPSLPHQLSDPAYASSNGALYLAGGTDGKTESANVLVLRDLPKGWESLTPLPRPVEAASAVVLGKNLYVVGGFSNGHAVNDLWRLDLRTSNASWEKLAPFPADARGYSAITTTGSRIYVFGGFTSPPYAASARVFDDAYQYDPQTNQWSKSAIAPLAGYGWTAAEASPTQVLLAGRVAEVGVVGDELWMVDLNSADVRRVGSLVTPNCCAPLIPMGEHRWWYVGGEPDTNRSRSDRVSIIQLKQSPLP